VKRLADRLPLVKTKKETLALLLPVLFLCMLSHDYKPYTLDPIRTFMPIVEKQKGAN
jgi:hypothetical protein